jgi:hypothetical protein
MRMQRWFGVLIVVGVLFGGACALPTTADRVRLQPTLELDRSTLRPGEEVTIRLTIRNPGHATVRLTGSSSCPPFGFGIVGADHQPVDHPHLPRLCTADLRSWSVPAGGSIEHTFRWSGDVELADGTRTRVLPGEYRLQGVIVAPPDDMVTGEPVSLRVEGEG